jgi:hypothetical protein
MQSERAERTERLKAAKVIYDAAQKILALPGSDPDALAAAGIDAESAKAVLQELGGMIKPSAAVQTDFNKFYKPAN